MSGIIWGGISPHPPIIIAAIGRDELPRVANTVSAMHALARSLAEAAPDVLVVITPHGPAFADAVSVWTVEEMAGSFAAFGAADLCYTINIDFSLVAAIAAAATGLPVLRLDQETAAQYGFLPQLDHGLLVPLHFLKAAGIEVPIVPVNIGFLPPDNLYRFGKAIQTAADRTGKRVAVLASSDLSHRLTPGAPAGYHPSGAVFDREIARLLAAGDVSGILDLPEGLREEAGECGYRPLVMLLGALDGWEIKPEVLSYEGPFGVGYLVGTFTPVRADSAREFLTRRGRAAELQRVRREKESIFVQLARASLEAFVRRGEIIRPPAPLPVMLAEQAGVFVSLQKNGQLRGCIGTIGPTRDSIAAEIIENAISAGTRDPRFDPVTPDELAELVYSVDILREPEAIDHISQLDPAHYGVIVRRGQRCGLLLPNLEGVDTAEAQIAIAKQKAGIGPGEAADIERFEVIRYH
ncbi:MAG: AmmeMemoRadiSam system protein A [bacterium]